MEITGTGLVKRLGDRFGSRMRVTRPATLAAALVVLFFSSGLLRLGSLQAQGPNPKEHPNWGCTVRLAGLVPANIGGANAWSYAADGTPGRIFELGFHVGAITGLVSTGPMEGPSYEQPVFKIATAVGPRADYLYCNGQVCVDQNTGNILWAKWDAGANRRSPLTDDQVKELVIQAGLSIFSTNRQGVDPYVSASAIKSGQVVGPGTSGWLDTWVVKIRNGRWAGEQPVVVNVNPRSIYPIVAIQDMSGGSPYFNAKRILGAMASARVAAVALRGNRVNPLNLVPGDVTESAGGVIANIYQGTNAGGRSLAAVRVIFASTPTPVPSVVGVSIAVGGNPVSPPLVDVERAAQEAAFALHPLVFPDSPQGTQGSFRWLSDTTVQMTIQWTASGALRSAVYNVTVDRNRSFPIKAVQRVQ